MSTTVKIFHPEGRIDGSRVHQFRQEVDSILEGESALLLIDLSAVPFVDSSGLGAMVSVLKTLRAKGGDIALCSLSEGVKILFKLTRMDKVFEIYENKEAFLSTRED
jgi:anti-sigma B factor antagonist